MQFVDEGSAEGPLSDDEGNLSDSDELIIRDTVALNLVERVKPFQSLEIPIHLVDNHILVLYTY